jgi:hypothetical protein
LQDHTKTNIYKATTKEIEVQIKETLYAGFQTKSENGSFFEVT